MDVVQFGYGHLLWLTTGLAVFLVIEGQLVFSRVTQPSGRASVQARRVETTEENVVNPRNKMLLFARNLFSVQSRANGEKEIAKSKL